MWLRLSMVYGQSVERLQDEIDSQAFGEIIAYFAIEPFGTHGDDIRTARICSTVAASAGAEIAPEEFLPKWSDVDTDETRSASDKAVIFFEAMGAIAQARKGT